ncbi:MAG: ferric reductase-like transmembrane domain-containing protein [Hyphomicrobiaceae bacterium]|nr:ferric reductase-like transmembrane domain-containing protein [Hyphomicrobiaceae bacterium]
MRSARGAVIWSGVAAAIVVPIAAAAMSEQLAWRHPVYIAAGFAGIVGLALLLVQPMLMSRSLPGLPAPRGRRLHRWIGILLVGTVIAHVGGLWVTSAPDVIDALLFVSPTPFSAWGVIAMWAVFAVAVLAAVRRRLRPRVWHIGHMLLAAIIVAGSVVHALLIEGTMETISKVVLCALVVVATLKVIADLLAGAKRATPP